MTVSYSGTVATVRYNSFVRLLKRWRGSVYKAVWPVIVVYCVAYAMVALTYHFLPNQTESDRAIRRKFVQICAFAGHVSSAIPISFFLGFFVNLVVDRWWQQFLNLPTPDSVSLLLSTYLVHEPHMHTISTKSTVEERPLLFRRTIARYLNLSVALCFHSISLSVKRKIPRLDDLVATGLMTNEEVQIYQVVAQDQPFFFIPLVWSISLLTRAHYEGMIRHERHLDSLVTAVVNYWNQLHTLFLYDYVNIPLVYNQVVTLGVYLYLAILVLSQQFADPSKILQEYEKEMLTFSRTCNSSVISSCMASQDTSMGLYQSQGRLNATLIGNQTLTGKGGNTLFSTLLTTPNIPVFAILSLICYAGWLRVAESHVFPFGDEDDHFEAIPLMDRNFKTSLWYVDQMMDPSQFPSLLKTTGNLESAETGKTESVFNTESLQYLSPFLFDQKAMGWKRNSHYSGDEIPTTLPAISITAPDDQAPIPELPCPNELRRRASRHFFSGSMTRIYGDEPTTQHLPLITVSTHELRPSLPAIEPTNLLPYSTGRIEPVSNYTGGSIAPDSIIRPLFSSAQGIVTPNSDVIHDPESGALNNSPTSTVQL